MAPLGSVKYQLGLNLWPLSLSSSLSLSLFLDVVKCFIPSTANSIAIFTKELHLNPSYEGNQREGPLHRSQFKVSNDTYNY